MVPKTGRLCCRVLVFYNWMNVLKILIAPVGGWLIFYFWVIKMVAARKEQDRDTPCFLGRFSYKCFIVNIDEIEFYYNFMVLKSIFWIVTFLGSHL